MKKEINKLNYNNIADKEDEPIIIRDQHYFFTQKVLYNYLIRHTEGSLAMFTSDNDKDFAHSQLKALWYKAYTSYKDLIPDIQKIDYSGLPFTAIKVDEAITIVVLTLPEPLAMTESYFIGICYYKSDSDSKVSFRYFTLEYHDSNKCALCEVKEDVHLLVDFLKTCDSKKFLDEIIKFIK